MNLHRIAPVLALLVFCHAPLALADDSAQGRGLY